MSALIDYYNAHPEMVIGLAVSLVLNLAAAIKFYFRKLPAPVVDFLADYVIGLLRRGQDPEVKGLDPKEARTLAADLVEGAYKKTRDPRFIKLAREI